MIRKDEFLDLLGSQNSTISLNTQLADLETFVDDALRNNTNILSLINSTTATTLSLDNGLEIVNIIKPTNIVHRDSTIKGISKILEGTNGVSYTLWDNTIDSLKYPNNSDATTTPWLDKVIGESVDTSFIFDGKLRIQLPPTTNKFVAKILANKYMSIGTNNSGYWGKANRPNDKNNNVNSGNALLNDGVRVLYDKTNNIVYLEFKLF